MRLGLAECRRWDWRANCPHGFATTPRLFTVPPFAGVSHVAVTTHPATLEELSSPSVHAWRAWAFHRMSRTVSPWTYRPALFEANLETAWDSHRSVLSVIVNRRRRQPPRVLDRRTAAPSAENSPRRLHGASARFGAWHAHEAETRRLPIYSCPAPPSPSVAGRRWLRPPLGGGHELLDESGLAQVGLDSPSARRTIAPFETKPTTPAAHTNRRA